LESPKQNRYKTKTTTTTKKERKQNNKQTKKPPEKDPFKIAKIGQGH
jgi:hypothetical protein